MSKRTRIQLPSQQKDLTIYLESLTRLRALEVRKLKLENRILKATLAYHVAQTHARMEIEKPMIDKFESLIAKPTLTITSL